ncbi:epimerase [Candidatus Pacearchaeota archaeon CG10_big_fil_rev_8_21_14_0_10_34_12]|nr:MAG: epimerase [Candidatus Pacearchaeota archaeon CG10_big_fil_rev_8_21_14_0_10_34_12]
MKIIVFGSTGKTGQEVVKQALEKNHKVVAFARNPEKIKTKNKNLKIVQGDVLNKEDVSNAIKYCEAVISVLGVNPFSKPIEDAAIKNIISAMKKHKVKRIVVESAYGTRETRKGIYPFFLWILLKPNLIAKERMENYLENSGLEWTIVKPPILTNGKKTGKYLTKEKELIGFHTISRKDVAEFIIKAVEEKRFIHQKIVINH